MTTISSKSRGVTEDIRAILARIGCNGQTLIYEDCLRNIQHGLCESTAAGALAFETFRFVVDFLYNLYKSNEPMEFQHNVA